MLCKGVGLLFLALLFSGCASLEEPRWALLGDTEEKAYFLDREQVDRQANGNYRYTVKTCLYQEGQPHLPNESHDTNRVLFIEMSCQERHWQQLWSGFMNQDGKILFRQTNPGPVPQPVRPNTIHFSAYNYLCGEKVIVAQHNH